MLRLWIYLALLCSFNELHAREIRLACASSLTPMLEKLSSQSPVPYSLISASTGKLATQIALGAPFDFFLAADPQAIQFVKDNGKIPDTQEFPFAKGRLAVISTNGEINNQNLLSRMGGDLIVPNTSHAPFGRAAQSFINQLPSKSFPKTIVANNAAHAFLLSQNHGSALAFVSMSHVIAKGERLRGHAWELEPGTYDPIQIIGLNLKPQDQNLIQLEKWLRSPEIQRQLRSFGFHRGTP